MTKYMLKAKILNPSYEGQVHSSLNGPLHIKTSSKDSHNAYASNICGLYLISKPIRKKQSPIRSYLGGLPFIDLGTIYVICNVK